MFLSKVIDPVQSEPVAEFKVRKSIMVSRLSSKLEEYAQATSYGEAAFKNCFGFIDGTVRPICRPDQNQREVYNGHNKVYGHFNQFHCPTEKLQSSMHK